MDGDVFTQLSLVLVIAAAVALTMRAFKQPMIMGYILTGILVGPSVLHIVDIHGTIEIFSKIGVALLLFIVGMELSAAVIRRMGKPVVITALALLFTIGTLGYIVGVAFKFSQTEAIITGLALFFSSTIIIAKVLSDKKELSRLNGQIAVGVILLDDIVATFALLFVAAQSGGSLSIADVALLAAKGITFALLLIFCGIKIMPKLAKHIAKSQELLFLSALAWGFGVASLANAIGFSIEVGALFAGVALAHLPYTHQIGARLKPLRDFFIALFFISLGQELHFENLAAGILPAIALSLIVLILKPLAVITSLGLLGYTKRTSFKAGINLSQISEFSIILTVLANSTGLVSNKLTVVITLVAIITISISTYLMEYDNWLYAKFDEKLRIFQRKSIIEQGPQAKEYELVLFGYRNGGHHILDAYQRLGKPYIVVDYHPSYTEELERQGAPYIYGDVTDPDLLDEINIGRAKLIVNIIGDHAVNMTVLRYIRRHNKQATIVCYSKDQDEADELYKLGATYVLLPYQNSSYRLSNLITEYNTDKSQYRQHRKQYV